ncbi:MAG: orotate phosphoribosyltransferase [Alphaproteobacteria bacterium]|nr:orotate phosphoribosyltransferase [Alphaproteobacteria bacterium]
MQQLQNDRVDAPALDLAKRRRLADIIARRSLLRGSGIKLVSGAVTSFYFDMKLALFEPEAVNLIGELVLQALADEPAEFVGGLELGAVPIATAVAQKSFGLRELQGFFVRKEPKGHGTRRLIEGIAEPESMRGRPVVLLEDVTTTGGSAMKALAAVREVGALVRVAITLVDRLEGATENLAKEGLRLIPLLTTRDFVI